MSLDPQTLVAILAMAAVTYLARISGFWLVRRVPLRGRLAAGLEAVPGAVLIALIAPLVLAEGLAESFAAILVVLVALRAPTLIAVVVGVAAVALLRALI